MSMRDKKEAFVTLATNDTYSLGCLVLGNSLRRVNTTRQLVVMVSIGVSNPMRSQLAQVFDVIQEVNVLDSNDSINLALLGRPDLNVTFTKLHCWRLTQYDKAVFLDADTLVLQNVDELFDREELSAAPDAGWPDCFNSGVFVFKPSLETYESVLSFATSQGSFDGGDQGLLNMYFKTWASEDISKHLPFIYNVVSQAFYSYLPAFTQFKDRVRIVHFIGAVKPWHHTYDPSSSTVHPLPGTGHSQEFLQIWWNIFMAMVQPCLDPTLREELTVSLFAPWPPPMRDVPQHSDVPFVGNTVPAVIPYKPPNVDEVFYEVDKDSLIGNVEDQIVEVTIIPRSYSELESHYAEEPISQINPADPPAGTYSAPWITEGWEKGTKRPNDNPPDFTIAHKSDENELEALESIIEPESNENGITEEVENAPSSHTVKNEPMSPVGLVGELATMSLQSASSPPLPVPDEERKHNWEKGQIDYLGQDSFENIQKKIDDTLNTEGASAPTTTVSPFTPKSSEPTSSVVVRPAQHVVAAPPKTVVPKQEASSMAKPPPKSAAAVAQPKQTVPVVQPKVAAKAPPPAQTKVAAPVRPVVPRPTGAALPTRPAAPAAGSGRPAAPGAVSARPAVPGAVSARPSVPGAVPTRPAAPGAASTRPAAPGVASTRPGVASTRSAAPGAASTRPAAPGAASTRPAAPGAASTRPTAPTKTSSLNIQAFSKKK